jgi:2-iminoacetate synthase ThiH
MESMTAGSSTIEALVERIAAGAEILEADAQLLLDTPDLITVGAIADDVRRRIHGSSTTFVRVFEVHADAAPTRMPPRTSAGELRVVGKPASVEAAVVVVKAAVALGGGAPVTGFSLADLLSIEGSSLHDVCARLRDAGLAAIADAPIDLLTDAASAIGEARAAGLLVGRVTTNALTSERRLEASVRARDLQQAVGGLQAFAPLPRQVSIASPTTGYDDVKLVAAARLLVQNIPSIQVDWVQYGPKLAQVALTMGADDVDGIAALDPGILGTRRSPLEEIRGNIHAAGLEAVERDGLFSLIEAAGKP